MSRNPIKLFGVVLSLLVAQSFSAEPHSSSQATFMEDLSRDSLVTSFLTDEELRSLEETIDFLVQSDLEEILGNLHRFSVFSEKWNVLDGEQRSRYACFLFSDPYVYQSLQTMLKSEEKFEALNFGLEYIKDNIGNMLDFSFFAKNSSLLAKVRDVNPQLIDGYLDRKEYVELFLYLLHIQPADKENIL